MIVSHKHKFIFIKTRKTAGTSIETLLASVCGPRDIITPISEEAERKIEYSISSQNIKIPFYKYTFKDWARLFLKWKFKQYNGHIDAKSLSGYLGKKVWNNYYKFCFDRNPCDKSLSMYYWKGGNNNYNSFKNFLETDGRIILSNWKIYAHKDQILVNKIFKYENLDESIEELSQIIGVKFKIDIKDIKFKTSSKIEVKEKIKSLSFEEIELIKDIHTKEFEYFDYKYIVK